MSRVVDVEESGPARAAYLRLRAAAGLTALPELQERLDRLTTGIREEVPLHRGLSEVVARLEHDLVPMLERRMRRLERLGRDDAHAPEDVTHQ